MNAGDSTSTQMHSPTRALAQMISGYWISQGIYAAAKLGIADLLEKGPRTVEDLAAATGTQPRALYRLLRALASVGLFVEKPGGTFNLAMLGTGLLTSAPGSQRPMAIMMGEEHYRAWGELL